MYQYTEERDEHGSVDAGQKIVVAVVDALQIVQLGEAVLRYLPSGASSGSASGWRAGCG